MPHITLSFGRESGDQSTSGDLTALGLGLAALVAWMFSAPLGTPALLARDAWVLAPLSDAAAFAMRFGFICALAVLLMLIGCTDQRFLRFYVGRTVLLASGALGAAGTLLCATCGLTGDASVPLACAGSILMAAAATVLMALWTTAFARYEFPTITLNAMLGVVLGLALSIALVAWMPAGVSLLIEVVLVASSALLLSHMTPIPYYRRQEMPIFHALQVSQVPFLLRLGIPAVIFGVSLGILGGMCVRGVFCTDDVANDLTVGAACALCAVVFITAVALLKNEAHWDTLFRFMLPLVGVGMIGIPLFDSDAQIGAVFLMAGGLAIMLSLLWVLYSDMSQEFRLSPIFVFGIGGGLLMVGTAIGALLTPQTYLWPERGPIDWTGLAMVAVVCLMFAGALMPRKRTMLRMLVADRVEDATRLNQILVDSATARGMEATDEQADAANPEIAEDAASAPDASDDETASESVRCDGHSDAPEADRADAAATGQADDAAEDADNEQAKPQKGSFYKRCEQIADQYLLSRRETEVLFLLAKGHKAGFIEDKLCVSRSTAKTHINHIYKKLNIHTQQELLNMVEDRPRPHSERDADAPHLEAPLHHGF